MPALDRLAREGMRFENAFCTNSICVPSRATLMTGQYSHTNGIRTLDGILEPAVVAGHSLGEFSALVCAGALAFADAVQLVKRRGAFMQTAVPVGEGAMAAILGLDDDKVREVWPRDQWGEPPEAMLNGSIPEADGKLLDRAEEPRRLLATTQNGSRANATSKPSPHRYGCGSP